MEQFFSSGLAVDIVLAVLLIEFVILWRKGWSAVDAALLLLPAAMIALALRASLTDMHWIWIAAPLAAAFPIHLADLVRRKR